jgi:hemerythrin
MLNWTPALAVGVAEIDAQHQELFRRADAFLEGLQSCSAADVARLLGFLRDHARAHFGAEEDWMRQASYPDLEAHRAEHQRFLSDLEKLSTGDGAAGAAPLEVASWLVRWLHDHVVRADGAAARFALARAGDAGRGGRQ